MSRILVSTKELPHEEWLKYRRTGIGGSDASTIIGLNPYNSLFKLYADKKGFISAKEDNEAMRQGRDFEEYVAKRFCEATGKNVRRRNYMFQHDNYDYILADIDREVVGENAGLECKTTSLFNKSDFENGEIPLTYYVQMMHYMAVMGYEKMYLAVLILSKGFYWFEVERNENEIDNLISAEISFWNNHIIPSVPPEIDSSDATKEALSEIYPFETDVETNVALPEDLMSEYERVSDVFESSKAKLEEIKNTIKGTLGQCAYGKSDSYKVSFKNQERTTIDSKALKAKCPEIYKQFSKKSSVRTLRISMIKE